MTPLVLVLVSLSLAISLLVAAALVEMSRRLDLLNSLAGVSDEQEILSLEAVGDHVSEYGLPEYLNGMSGVLLFVSARCATCHGVLDFFAGSIPEGLHLVVTGTDPDLAEQWMSDYDLSLDDTIYDHGNLVADAMNIQLTPLAFELRNGVIASARSIPRPEAIATLLGSHQRKVERE